MCMASSAGTTPSQQVIELAESLFRAFETGAPVAPPSEALTLSVDDAYAVQRALVDAHRHAGRSVVGRKIGLTSLAMQRQLGIDNPDFGVLLDTHVWTSGVRLSRRKLRMIAPKLEPEIAFVLERDLRGPGITADHVLAATAAVVPVFEVIDSRVRDWRITLTDTVADNASSLGAVIGELVPIAGAGDLSAITVRFSADGQIVQEGTGAAVMGNPAAAVAWVADELARFDEALPAGQPILAGSFTAAVDASPGRYEASFGPGLGSVTVEIED
jgi:2-keto-4-pentenoate hydratase